MDELRRMDLAKMHDPFPASDVEWRLQTCGKNASGFWARALAYITNRAIMERLDEVCGPENWRNEFQTAPVGGVLCGISIRVGLEWVTKWDGAENTDIEAVKGGLSGAMKRAAVQWGIGRYLYNLEEGWATCYTDERKGSFHGQTKDKDRFSWDPPTLPAWALPSGAGKPGVVVPMQIPAKQSQPEARDEFADRPKTPPAQRNARDGFDVNAPVGKGAHKTETWAALASTEKGREYIGWALGKWTDLSPAARTALQGLLDAHKAGPVESVQLQDLLNRAAAAEAITIEQAARVERVIDERDTDTMSAARDWLENQLAKKKLGAAQPA